MISAKHIITLRKNLSDWFLANKRSLPWRDQRNWYKIWISEVMLQQTRVDTVIPYFRRFIEKFPTLQHLTAADFQSVLKIWEGLGYYARARNLYKAAQVLAKKHNGVLPDSEELVRQLPGFGAYITSAVMSLAHNRPLAVVDGNIMRVIARIFGIQEDIRSSIVQKKILEHMKMLLDPEQAGIFNEAMMELGATICLPKNPACITCPLNSFCESFKTNRVGQIPYKSAQAPKKTVYSIARIFLRKGKVLIALRPESGLLGGFWEFPVYTISNGKSPEDIAHTEILFNIGKKAEFIQRVQPVRHTYTHFQLYLYGYMYSLNQNPLKSDFYEQYRWVEFDTIDKYPIHRAMTKMIVQLKKELKIIAE